jgi:2-octaprenylphenol hydroxylase
MSRDFDVVVIGGGVAGSVVASLLLAHKLCAAGKVALVAERLTMGGEAAADWDPRVFALSRASERILRDAGVWQNLPSNRVFGYERMCVWDAEGTADGRGSLSFDCAEIGEPNLGHIVDGRALQVQAQCAARDAGVVLIEATVRELVIADDAARIRLGDGRELRSTLIVAADGAESPTRRLLGIATAGHSYDQDALVAQVRTAQPHRETAWQRFLPTGPLAFLPLPDGRASIVWSTSRKEAARLRALDAPAFNEELTQASAGALGACELLTPLTEFPLRLQYALDYIVPRVVLLGDAAHVVHPLAGQGLNLGLNDCAALLEVLGDAGNVAAFGDTRVLRRYERWRKSENLLAATALDGIERLFSNSNPTLAGMRSLGLGAVAKLDFVRRQAARRALGLSGDVPLRGGRPSPHR